MRKATRRVTNGKKTKPQLSDRSRMLFDRIRRRREQIQARSGMFSDSSDLIREEREQRF